MSILEEEEVHQNAHTYEEVIFNKNGQPRGRVTDEKKDRQEAKKKEEEEEVEKSPYTSTSVHLGLAEEVEEVPEISSYKEER
jgi:hypothetical protein